MNIFSGMAFSVSFAFAAIGAPTVANADRAGLAENVQVAAFQARAALGQKVEVGAVIYQKARLYTHQYGSMDIRLDDGTRLTVAPNASIMVDDFIFASGRASVGLSLARGALKMVSGRLASESYAVTTPVATIGVRGTEFWLNTVGEDRIELWVLDGTVTANPSQSDTVFAFTAPAYAQCTVSACEEGAAPPVPASYPLDPTDIGNVQDRGSAEDPGGQQPGVGP